MFSENHIAAIIETRLQDGLLVFNKLKYIIIIGASNWILVQYFK